MEDSNLIDQEIARLTRDLELAKLRRQSEVIAEMPPHSFVIGANVIVRCIAYHYIGRVKAITATELVLAESGWLAESKRWNETLRTGEIDEYERYPDGLDNYVARETIMDWAFWLHKCPTETL